MFDPNLSEVPAPAGAEVIDDWEVIAEAATPFRHFIGRKWVVQSRMGNGRIVDDVIVRISGTQWATRQVERDVPVEPRSYTYTRSDGTVETRTVSHTQLSLPQTRELAQALLAACDEVERLNSIDGIDER